MKQHSITSFQAFTMVLMTVVGMNVLMFPRSMGEIAGRDGIWVMLILVAIVAIILYFMTLLGQWFPRDSYVEYTEKILGSNRYKWVGKVLHIPFLLVFGGFWLFLVAYTTREFGEIVVITILPHTPLDVIMIVFILTAAVAASYPPEVIVKFNELLFPFILIPTLFITISFIQHGEWINFLPLFQANWREVLQTVTGLITDFSGFSIIFILMANYQQPDKAVQSHMLGIFVSGLIFWLVFSTTLGVFGVNEMNRLTLPTLEIVKLIRMPFQIFERLESVTIALWVVANFTTLANVYFALVELVRRKLALKPTARKWISIFWIPVIFVLSMTPQSLKQLTHWISEVGKYIFAMDLTIPIFLVVIAWMRKKRGKNYESSATP